MGFPGLPNFGGREVGTSSWHVAIMRVWHLTAPTSGHPFLAPIMPCSSQRARGKRSGVLKVVRGALATTPPVALFLARPHVRHSEWAEEDHLKSAARFCWWGSRTLPHVGSPPSGARVERGWRQQRHAAPPVARCACASGPGSREPPALAGAGSLRAVCGSASSPQTPSSALDGRRAPLARAAATFFAGCKTSHHCRRAV